MKCLECQELLQRRLDGIPLADHKGLEQHLADCVSCREQHAAAARLLRGLGTMQTPVPPPGLARRINAAVLRDRAVRRQRMKRRLYVTAALAASVFVMLLVSYWQQPRAPQPAGALETPVAKANPTPSVPAPPAPEVEAPQARAGLSESVVESLNALLPDVPIKELPAVAELEPLDPAAQSLKQAGREVTASLQTVTRSARQAFDYFSRELPSFELSTRE